MDSNLEMILKGQLHYLIFIRHNIYSFIQILSFNLLFFFFSSQWEYRNKYDEILILKCFSFFKGREIHKGVIGIDAIRANTGHGGGIKEELLTQGISKTMSDKVSLD